MPRAAKTIREHLLHGTVPQGKPEKPSAFQGGRPKFPAHLSAVARREAKRIAKILLERGTCTPGDFAAIALYAELYARWVSLKENIGDEWEVDTVVLDSNGVARTVRRVNPLLKILAATEARMQSTFKSLAITPLDREKAKQTSPNQKEEIVPGSMADLMPELLVIEGKKK
jgi:P27 family predicted phage terminase small subunit